MRERSSWVSLRIRFSISLKNLNILREYRDYTWTKGLVIDGGVALPNTRLGNFRVRLGCSFLVLEGVPPDVDA